MLAGLQRPTAPPLRTMRGKNMGAPPLRTMRGKNIGKCHCCRRVLETKRHRVESKHRLSAWCAQLLVCATLGVCNNGQRTSAVTEHTPTHPHKDLALCVRLGCRQLPNVLPQEDHHFTGVHPPLLLDQHHGLCTHTQCWRCVTVAMQGVMRCKHKSNKMRNILSAFSIWFLGC